MLIATPPRQTQLHKKQNKESYVQRTLNRKLAGTESSWVNKFSNRESELRYTIRLRHDGQLLSPFRYRNWVNAGFFTATPINSAALFDRPWARMISSLLLHGLVDNVPCSRSILVAPLVISTAAVYLVQTTCG
jgi:hypothetical protein